MKGMRKKNKIPALARIALAENVKYLMEEKYAALNNRPRALARDAGVGLYTVQRIIDATTGANLDTIESIAKVFNAEPYELLTPLYAKRRQQNPGEHRVVPIQRKSSG